MVMWCPVGVSILCAVMDPACQSYGQSYSEISQLEDKFEEQEEHSDY
jgi:hypothetical protein